eukprot:1153799-Pelagomonas_calceolata.AAC.9
MSCALTSAPAPSSSSTMSASPHAAACSRGGPCAVAKAVHEVTSGVQEWGTLQGRRSAIYITNSGAEASDQYPPPVPAAGPTCTGPF